MFWNLELFGTLLHHSEPILLLLIMEQTDYTTPPILPRCRTAVLGKLH